MSETFAYEFVRELRAIAHFEKRAGYSYGIYERAADEIERLRTALASIERQLRGYAEFSPADELRRIAKEALEYERPSV